MVKRKRYLSRIYPFIGKPVIKILTGIRRCGKSVMLEMIKDELYERGIKDSDVLSINFETAQGMKYLDKNMLFDHLYKFLKGKKNKQYIFLDEIQQGKGWEKIVNSIQIDYDADIYLTGSNATLLSSDLSTFLAGRYVTFQVHPFSFSEFVSLFEKKDLSRKELFQKYIVYGGMPFLKYMDLEYQSSMQYLNDVFNSVVIKDIVTYNSIREVDLLERIIRYTLENIGNTFSATSISKYFKNEGRKVYVDTVLNYLSACEKAYLIRKVSRYDLKGKKILKVNEKYYVEDHGFREALIANNSGEIQKVLKNIVYMEMLSRGYQILIGKREDKEIDFICTKNREKIYIQVAYLLPNQKTVEREFSVFDKINDNYQKIVLSLDDFNFSRRGIEHHNLIDFLMKNEPTIGKQS